MLLSLGLYWTVWDRFMQVLYLGRAPRTKKTLPDFLKWSRVTRCPLVFRGLTGSQRTPRFWGVTAWYQSSGFKAKVYDFIFLCLLFFFFFFLEDNIDLQLLVTQTYPRLSTCLRPVWQSGRRSTNLQPIEAIWSAVRELAQRGKLPS